MRGIVGGGGVELYLYLMGIFLIFFEGLVVVDALNFIGFFPFLVLQREDGNIDE